MSARSGTTPRLQHGQATPSIVAVVSVVAVVAALVAFFAGGDPQPAPEPQAQSAPVPSQTPTPTADATPTSGPSDAPARAKNRRDRDERKEKKRRPRPAPDQGPPDVYIEVYNNSSVSGLAASTAADLQDGGWQVVGVDNWYGQIPSSTVYYPSGMEAEAEELARALGVARVRGAVAPMKFDRLTVILTADAA